MKTYKLADLAAQVVIIIAGLFCVMIKWFDTNFIYLYFLVGGWQVLSFLIHLGMSKSWIHRKDRIIYGKILLGTILAGIISYLLMLYDMPVIIFYLAALLFFSPIAAIWYFNIGLQEWRTIKAKELIHLK